jgi:hypothetical protein
MNARPPLPTGLHTVPGAATPPMDAIRVTGALAEDARLSLSTGQPPHAFLSLHITPIHGLAYTAQADLGDDATDHMAAEAMLPQLRRGALVSVGGRALRLRTDHGHALLQVLDARHVLLLQPAPAASATMTTANPSEDPHVH